MLCLVFRCDAVCTDVASLQAVGVLPMLANLRLEHYNSASSPSKDSNDCKDERSSQPEENCGWMTRDGGGEVCGKSGVVSPIQCEIQKVWSPAMTVVPWLWSAFAGGPLSLCRAAPTLKGEIRGRITPPFARKTATNVTTE